MCLLMFCKGQNDILKFIAGLFKESLTNLGRNLFLKQKSYYFTRWIIFINLKILYFDLQDVSLKFAEKGEFNSNTSFKNQHVSNKNSWQQILVWKTVVNTAVGLQHWLLCYTLRHSVKLGSCYYINIRIQTNFHYL